MTPAKKQTTDSSIAEPPRAENKVVRHVVEVVEDDAPSIPASSTPSNAEVQPEAPSTPAEVSPPVQVSPQPIAEVVPEPQVMAPTTPEVVTPALEPDPQPVDPPKPEVPAMSPPPQLEEKQKSTVEELFGKNEIPVTPEIDMHTAKTSKKVLFLWAISMLLLAVLISGGLVIAFGGSIQFQNVASSPTPTPAAIVTTEPTPSPTVMAVDKSALRIEVLNGGGVPGAASKMKTLLEEKGYTVVGTRNAPSYTYDKTEIEVKSGFESYILPLEEDVGTTYTVGSSSASLSSGAAYDARVIVGKE